MADTPFNSYNMMDSVSENIGKEDGGENFTDSLATLLSIWPIAESFAKSLPVGDLITLSRTNRTLRASLHGQMLSNFSPDERIRPQAGQHQTSHWARLKMLAAFTCASQTHTKGKNSKPCVYCSRPICDACIVRDSFKNLNESTFKNRLRYLCQDCWCDARPTRMSRYPAVISDTGISTDDASEPDTRSMNKRRSLSQADRICTCTFKDHGWLCLECKEAQNRHSASISDESSARKDRTRAPVRCVGMGCGIEITGTGQYEQERRKICLWCEKPLRRKLESDYRYAWNLKTQEARAAIVESRTKDMEEYNRSRRRALRMSRHELRSVRRSFEDDRLLFVRDLDTVNYRNFMSHSAIPSPDMVWKSKHGVWEYTRDFLLAVQSRTKWTGFNVGLDVERLQKLTKDGALQYARSNLEVESQTIPPWVRERSSALRTSEMWNVLKARVQQLHMVEQLTTNEICIALLDQYGFCVSIDQIQKQLDKWNNLKTYVSPENRDENSDEEVLDLDAAKSMSEELEALLDVQQEDEAGEYQQLRQANESAGDTEQEPSTLTEFPIAEVSRFSTPVNGTVAASPLSTDEVEYRSGDAATPILNTAETDDMGHASTDDPPPYSP